MSAPVYLARPRPARLGSYYAGDAAIVVADSPAAALAAYRAVFPYIAEIWAHPAEACPMPDWARWSEPKCYRIVGEGIHTQA